MTKEEAKEFAKSIGATFRQTSALSKVGIEELFNELGKRFLDSDFSNNRINSENKEIKVEEEREKGVKLSNEKETETEKAKKKKRLC